MQPLTLEHLVKSKAQTVCPFGPLWVINMLIHIFNPSLFLLSAFILLRHKQHQSHLHYKCNIWGKNWFDYWLHGRRIYGGTLEIQVLLASFWWFYVSNFICLWGTWITKIVNSCPSSKYRDTSIHQKQALCSQTTWTHFISFTLHSEESEILN